MGRLITDDWARDSIRRAGFDPDDPDSLRDALTSPEHRSVADWVLESVVHTPNARVPATWEPTLRELVFEGGTGASDRQTTSLDLLDRLLGADVLTICRKALAAPEFQYKPSAVHGIAKYGDRSDVDAVLDWIKCTVRNRKRNVGHRPIAEGADFIRRVDIESAKQLRNWLIVRWYRVSFEFRTSSDSPPDDGSHWYRPELDRLPRTILVSGSGEAPQAMASRCCRFFSRFSVVSSEQVPENVAGHARLVITTDAKAAAAAQRQLDRVDHPIPCIQLPTRWTELLDDDRSFRRVAAWLAEAAKIVDLDTADGSS